MAFGMDLRGLNAEHVEVVLNYLREPTNYVTIREVQKDYVKVEVDESQRMVLTFGGSLVIDGGLDDVKQCLAGMVDFACRQRSDLFMPNANYGWLGRIWYSF
jgi:hypothetical protein